MKDSSNVLEFINFAKKLAPPNQYPTN